MPQKTLPHPSTAPASAQLLGAPTAASSERRVQILDAAVRCFARQGLRQTTMHDLSAEAGISVGLIYRYFEGKDQVIQSLAEEHLRRLQAKLDQARAMPRLAEALETVLWCDQHGSDAGAAFVVELFAEAAHDPHVRAVMRTVQEGVIDGITALISAAPESASLAPGVTARQAAEIVFRGLHGQMLDELLLPEPPGAAAIRQHRREGLHRLLALLLSARSPRPAAHETD